MIRTLSALVLSLFIFSAFAQHPEILSYSKSHTATTHLELAKEQYDLGQYDSANTLFLTLLGEDMIKGPDFLIVANSLMAEHKISLAKEFFQLYLKETNNTFGIQNDLVNSIFKKDTQLLPSSSLVSGSDALHSMRLYNGLVYGSNQGMIYSHNYSVNNELVEKRLVHGEMSMISRSSISYFNDGFSAVITRSYTQSGGSALYVIHRTSDGWSKARKPLFEAEEANYCSPYFDENSGILYFSSDQDGGFGGYDLYMSIYKNGKFGKPINLGAVVNSARHEISPVKIDEWLYFSSNGHPSKGGFDLYKYKAIDDFTQLLLNVRKFNTEADEFAIEKLFEKNYLVNRSAFGNTEIVRFSNPRPLVKFSGRIIDQNNAPVPDAVLLISNENEGRYIRTNQGGYFNFQMDRSDQSVNIGVLAEGFSYKTAIIQHDVLSVITLTAQRSLEITKVYGVDSSEVRLYPNGMDSMMDDESEKVMSGVTLPDSDVYYVIVGSSSSYEGAYPIWTEFVETFDELEIIKFNDKLFRIGYKAGSEESEALKALKSTIPYKSDSWIIRPGMF